MKIEATESKPGRVWSLSISRVWSRFSLVNRIASVDGVLFIRRPGLASYLKDGPFAEFTFKGIHYLIQAEWPTFETFEIYPRKDGVKKETSELTSLLGGK